jgi:N,N'-diacetylchitobiose phosphorylase
MTRVFRGKKLTIKVSNPDGAQKGVKQLLLNGTQINGNVIPADRLLSENLVEVEMG